MTVQRSDIFINYCDDVELGAIYLHRIITGSSVLPEGWQPYPFHNQPDVPEGDRATDLYRGYVAEYELSPEGRLFLTGYHYPYALDKTRRHARVSEELVGDFWLVMQAGSYGPEVFIPFRDGVIVGNPVEWECDSDEPLDAIRFVRPPFHRKDVPLVEPVFVGTVAEVQFRSHDDIPRVTLDREIPREYAWCRVRLVRDGNVLCRARVGSNSGGGAGPWGLRLSADVTLQEGDDVYAIDRYPTEEEIARQRWEQGY